MLTEEERRLGTRDGFVGGVCVKGVAESMPPFEVYAQVPTPLCEDKTPPLTILKGLSKEESRERMKELLDKHRELKRQMYELEGRQRKKSEEMRPIREKMRLIEAQKMVKVGEMRDEENRLFYPTQQLRRAAQTVRLAEDKEYQALKAEWEDAQKFVSPLNDEMRKLRFRLEEVEYEMRLLAAGA
ncbi:MAG: hypothetical protein U9R11_01435 [Chloroflexota bacterium]|nr:hypothetical protein [Chloroflexota bacterium]